MVVRTVKNNAQKLISDYEKEIKCLRQSVEKYFHIFYMSPNAIALLNADETFVEINPSFTSISGFTKEETIGKSLTDLGGWVHLADRRKILQMLAGNDKIHKIELPFYKKNGEILYAQLIVKKGILREQVFYLTIVRDISMQAAAKALQRKQEEALLISRNKLSTAAALANIGPWEYDVRKGHFEFCDEFYALYGTNSVREGKFMRLDEYIREFVHPEDVWMLAGHKELLSRSKHEKATIPNDIIHRIIRRDGAIRTVFVRCRLIIDEAGNIIKAYGTNQDITERIRDEEERRQQAEAIKCMAYYDSLTGLPNKNNLYEWLALQMKEPEAESRVGTVFFVDLDQLKLVNDAYGHNFGDKVIVAASTRIALSVGGKSFVARVGGDEFVVVLQGKLTTAQSKAFAKKIIGNLGKKQEHVGISIHVTASIGIADYPEDGSTVDEILKNTENAMYKAKKQGRNCYKFYSKELQDEVYTNLSLIEGLRYAIERKDLSLVYQPQILLPQKTVKGVEALLRWNSREYGNVSPARFIPLAEQSGVINSIGKWVLHEACSFASRLAQDGYADVRVAVNISARQVASDDFVKTLCNAVKTAGILPKQLEIEITESLLMASLDEAISKLNKSKALGFTLALDDFGTGYSSLTYLRKLPVETIKIDKSFIDMIENDIPGAKMIGAIINMANAINMTVVAEGVETERQLAYLVKEGCSCVQGYLFSKPLREQDAYKFIQTYNKGL